MDNHRDSFDFDWLVIGSGFGGSVSALRLAEKGHSVGVLECGRRFADDELPSSTADLKRYFWNPRLGMKGIFRLTTFRDVSVVSGCGVGGGSLGYANTLYVPPKAVLRGPPVGGDGGLGERAGAPLRRGPANAGRRAEPHDDPADQLLRELGEELGVGDTYKDARRRVLRRAGQDRRRSVLRRRGSRPHRLPAVRALHGRLPAWIEEHAGQELPVLRREARRARDGGTHRDRHPPARLARRRRGLRGRKRPLGRLAAQGPPRPSRAGRGRGGRAAGHEQAAPALPPERLAAAHLRAPGRAGADQLRSRS